MFLGAVGKELIFMNDENKYSISTCVYFTGRGFWSVTLPRDAHAHEGHVEYKDGMLRVHFPRDTQVYTFYEKKKNQVLSR
jgi:hypothetical protein